MEIKCPHCKSILETDEDVIGEVISCPGCEHAFVARTKNMDKDTLPKGNKIADYAIGILFGLIGVLIAWCSDGKEGAKFAARGCAIHFAIAAGLGIIASL